MTDTADFDTRLRTAALSWLERRTNDGTEPISSEELDDFEIDGRQFKLMDRQRGIRKPIELDSALSIRTTYRADPSKRPYADELGPDGLIRYKWRGDDPQHADNRALRAAWKHGVPLIWFVGIGSSRYQAIFPVFILAEEAEQQQFVVDVNVAQGLITPDSPVEERLRRYIMRETKRRLHQPVFRSTVLRAYETRCAVCSLRHEELLDAAHIVPDSETAGIAAVRNGLAMCKIHHAAFDRHILGIDPDLVVRIRQDILDEIDGPMLEHGLQKRHGQRLMIVPKSRHERPDAELLEISYTRFRTAS